VRSSEPTAGDHRGPAREWRRALEANDLETQLEPFVAEVAPALLGRVIGLCSAGVSDLLRVLVILGLVAANAFFVIGEYAVVSARRAALAPRAERGHAGARAALRLMDDPVRVISTVQVGITALGILTGAVSEPLVRESAARSAATTPAASSRTAASGISSAGSCGTTMVGSWAS
jgi:hypothetical protein